MNILDMNEVRDFVNEHITEFHNNRISRLNRLTLTELIKKNPYLIRAKNLLRASELVDGTMSAFISSSEEKMFGDFLEGLAIFIAQRTLAGHKSGTQGVDLEFDSEDCHYFVSIKSGPNWGNSSQHRKLGEDLQNAVRVFRQGRQRVRAETVLGICYGNAGTVRDTRYNYLKLVGQNFWTFISRNRDLYQEIIHPIAYRVKEHNDNYLSAKAAVTNRLEKQFIEQFCDERGVINWYKLIEANSGNYDLDKHGIAG